MVATLGTKEDWSDQILLFPAAQFWSGEGVQVQSFILVLLLIAGCVVGSAVSCLVVIVVIGNKLTAWKRVRRDALEAEYWNEFEARHGLSSH